MAAFNFHRRRTRRWWYVGTTLVVAAFFAVFFVTSSSALINSPSGFEAGDGNMTLEGASGATDWNCFQGANGFATLTSGTPANCAVTSGANQINADGTNNAPLTGEVEQKPGQKFDTACPTFQGGNNPPKDEWSNIAEYIEASPTLNSDNGHDIYFYGASIRPVVNGNSSGNIYFSQGTGCRTVGDILLTFDFLNGGGTTPVLHALSWQGAGGSCYVKTDSAPCWGPSTAPALSGDNSAGFSNGSVIQAADNAINGQQLPVNAFAEIGVNLTQAIKAAGGSATCFARETWVSRSSGSSFTSTPEDVEIDSKPTCGTVTIVKDTWDGAGDRTGINTQFSYSASTGLTPTSFHLNDAGGASGDVTCTADSTTLKPCNSRTYSNVQPGSYTVTEGANPPNFAFVSLTCVPQGNGTDASQDGSIPKQADITLAISGSVVCTYVNQQQLGAINIVKTSSKGTALNGAIFEITGPNNYDHFVTTSGTGTAKGKACVSGLPFGDYTVTETSAPTGYNTDPNSPFDAPVAAFGDCTTNIATAVEVDAVDTPLTDITAHVQSEAVGGTQSNIVCTDGTNNVGDSPQPASGNAASATVTANGLEPGTYTCTITIDP